LSQSASNAPVLDRETIQAALDNALDQFSRNSLAPLALHGLAAAEPDLFFAAVRDRLQAQPGAPSDGKRNLRLLDVPEFLVQLVSPARLSREELLEFCQRLIREDPLLDVKLARLLPGRQADPQHLDAAVVLRLLDVLDALSPGPRLTMVIGHLTQHADHRIASKAALLIGRRLHSQAWVETQLASSDPRVPANVVEALWGERTALAVRTFRQCLHDENNRVVGNALVGLHLVAEPDLGPRIEQLLKDARPAFRLTGVWVIEKTRDPQYAPWLEAAGTDLDPGVRQAALKALASFPAGQPQPS
jgi:hypothetical protein